MYCILHYPRAEKATAFKQVLETALANREFDLRGAWFPEECRFADYHFDGEVDFTGATFNGNVDFTNARFLGEAHFRLAEFHQGASFKDAVFNSRAHFRYSEFGRQDRPAAVNFFKTKFAGEADFDGASFSEEAAFWDTEFNAPVTFVLTKFLFVATFSGVRFDRADFRSAKFLGQGGGSFVRAIFNGSADFSSAQLGDGPMIFSGARFMSSVRFSASDEQSAWPSDVRFEDIEAARPDQVYFHNLTLSPTFFIGADVRKFNFTSVTWHHDKIREEMRILEKVSLGSLETACQRLAINREENQHYEDASTFRYLAMEARRLAHGHGFAPWRLSWWYWASSGYGERVLRGFIVLLGIWLLCALLYSRVGFVRWEPRSNSEYEAAVAKLDREGAPLHFRDAATYSLGVLTLQRPEPRPATTVARSLVMLETVFGPLQAGLLALAIRRKFMR